MPEEGQLSPDSQGAVGRLNKRVALRERCRRPWLVANRATLPAQVAAPPPECGRFV